MESRVFRLINFPLSLILSNLFLPDELLRNSLYTIAITQNTSLLNSSVAYRHHREGLVQHSFIPSHILLLSTLDLTAMLSLTGTLPAKFWNTLSLFFPNFL